MALSVADLNRIFISIVVNCCFAATFFVILTIIYRYSQAADTQPAQQMLGSLLPKAGGCGVLLAACTTIQLRLLGKAN
jgi:hypothetical protein